jgi:tetratricopeptide (TPR) repeat protein
VRQARDLEQDGELPEAIESYRQALQIDPDWEPAREALATALGNREQYEFDQLLSKGYAALGDEDYRDAVESFTRALELRPEASEARDGLFQAEEGLKRGQIALAEIRALAFERRELWGEAIAQYEAALATDPTLDYAITGLARAQRRQDLDVKITNLIENPRLLFDDSILAEAGELLEQARAVDDPGIRIQEQIEDLGRLVRLASTPQRVVLESDALTQVTVYRVGELGSFTSREIDLRPGEYVAIGSRNGYRDVRKSFTVLPGREAEPIRIVCVEPI